MHHFGLYLLRDRKLNPPPFGVNPSSVAGKKSPVGRTGYQAAPPSQAVPDISTRPSAGQDTRAASGSGSRCRRRQPRARPSPACPPAARVRVTRLRPPLLSIKAANNFSKKTPDEARPAAGLLTPARCAAAGRCHGGRERAGGFAGGNYGEKNMKLWVTAIKPSLPGSGKLN